MNSLRTRIYRLALTAALATPFAAASAYLTPDGIGQALIYPYYTAQTAGSNSFNTLISLVNHSTGAKAVRVRFREGRNSREVASLNVFLSPNDVWTGGIVPTASGARFISRDRSCVSPPLTLSDGVLGVGFTNDSYTSVMADGNGEGLDRTREGWIEVIEMATLTGASAAGVTHSNGVPANCSSVQGDGIAVGAPTGGLSGALTLINVLNGMEFSLNAEALADLSSRPFYRPSTDPYPSFNSAEIDPVSIVSANGFIYRSVWNRPVDAISATLMRASWKGEYVVDETTRSKTDFLVTFPTRQFYTGASSAPFAYGCQFPLETFAGEPATISAFDREERGGTLIISTSPTVPNFRCAASSVFDFRSASPHTAFTPQSHVLGSQNRALTFGSLPIPPGTSSGWVAVTPSAALALTSLPESTRTNIANGVVASGSHRFLGLPAVGFTARTFENGTLSCGGVVCQGNYGAAFPLRFTRGISGP